ncbi:YdcF family protein [Pseudoduganella namucuonensis]|uniref:Uncharacterized SAM-binding protein YcdF, DUF218 family n=1 Tax=Pseudoduganella namucuonensis TaxID=1035707 RepID=A0A1I7HDR8_9BURK|nr:YdcF family protein [Pseudoduganella namucuonensis]SFU58855.1 Uncharacterized SAM-binding protein YcdF, DUF218 family [Pseudoduganella namucuonensis]
MLLNKLIHLILLPPLSLLLLYATGLLLRRRHPRLGIIARRGAVGLLLVLSTNIAATALLRPLERMEPPLLAPAARGAQAIVILAAGSMLRAPEYGNQDVPDYITLARLRYGARLQQETGLPILVSGGNADPVRGLQPKAEGMARALREDFRTPVKWVEAGSETTAENAANSARMLAPAGVRRVLLVTDAMHMARARLVFERAGLEVVSAPTAYFTTHAFSPLQLLPSASGLSGSYYAVYEWLGLFWYKLRY